LDPPDIRIPKISILVHIPLVTRSTSSFIDSISPFCRFSHRVEVKMRDGGRYEIQGMDEKDHEAFTQAESHGKHFNGLRKDGRLTIRRIQ
jgi:hypothetical protein